MRTLSQEKRAISNYHFRESNLSSTRTKKKSYSTHTTKSLTIFQLSVYTVPSPTEDMSENSLSNWKAKDLKLFWTLFIQQRKSKFNKKASQSTNKTVNLVDSWPVTKSARLAFSLMALTSQDQKSNCRWTTNDFNAFFTEANIFLAEVEQ